MNAKKRLQDEEGDPSGRAKKLRADGQDKRSAKKTKERADSGKPTKTRTTASQPRVNDNASSGFQMFAASATPTKQASKVNKVDVRRSRDGHRSEAGDQSAAHVAANQADEHGADGRTNGIFKGAEEQRSFADLGLEGWLVKSCELVGLKRPTDIQWNCIAPALEGRDMLASAETGSGKTAAFALPILQQLSKDPFGIFGLILTPTRELAFQIQDQFVALGAKISLRLAVVVGGMDMMKQALELCSRPHVVVATPGRMADHVNSSVGVPEAMRRVRYLVLDEADRLLEPCFEAPLATILRELPASRVTWLYSATITSNIEELRRFAMKDCFQFVADDPSTTVSTVTERYIHLPKMVKECYLAHVLRESKAKSLIVFAGTRATCQFLSLLLEEIGEEVTAIHSGLKQLKRLAALDKFKAGRSRVLVATDVASRGLDIPTVELVVNYDIPQAAKDYIHRVGRTARAGRGGTAVSLVTQYDVGLVQNIEQSTGKMMEDAGVSEDDVLPLMSEVMKAKRVAKMKVVELESEGQDDKRRAGLNRTGLNLKAKGH